MRIQLKCESEDVAAKDIASLIAELHLETRTLAVELNLEVVSKSVYATTPLKEGDRVEIVHMIGGG